MSITLQQINKYYNRNRENEVHVLKDIDLHVAAGQVICLQGPSGSGKSTLLSIIGCLFPPTSGMAEVMGKRLSRLPDHFLTRHRRECIGCIFQRFHLIEDLTVTQNVVLPLLPLGYTPRQQEQMAGRLLEKLEIDHRKNFRVSNISGGELQRTAIARALILDPPIILADEPTAHLDSSLRDQFMAQMEVLKGEGKTIVITSHDHEIAQHGCIDRRYTMKDGHLFDGV